MQISRRVVVLGHIISLAVLIALFGGSFFSLSVDVAHHFAVIDAIIKNGTSNLPYIGVMSYYPALSYWVAAGIGHLVGSGLVAMWILCIIAIYVIYCCIFRLLSNDRTILPIVLFIFCMPLLIHCTALFGFEIVDNFFYPQLIGAAVYCGFLLYLSEQERLATWKSLFVTAVVACITMSIHGIPALEILATYGIVLAFSIVEKFIFTKKLGSEIDWIRLGFFIVICLCLVLFDPDFATLRKFSQNNGSIAVGIGFLSLGIFALSIIAILLHELIYFRADNHINKINFIFLSALMAAVCLMTLQYLFLVMLDAGSVYAVKKHTYFVFTMSTIASIHVLAYRIQPYFGRRQLFPVSIVVIIGAVLMTASILRRPRVSLYPIIHQINYAENAVAISHPNFKPGNTAVVAPNINVVIRYLITTTAFQMKVAEPPAVSMLDSTFDASKSVEYVMVQSSSASNKSCGTRYAETSEFSIVPVSCLKE